MKSGTTSCRPLLDSGELLSAIQGRVDDGAELVMWAARLGTLYRDWVSAPATDREIRREIGTVIAEIDAWVSGQLPRPLPGVPRGTESIGSIMGRLAEAWACAWWSLQEADDDMQRHRAWEHLAEMSQGYQDLARLILGGLIILPKSWPGLGWPVMGPTAIDLPSNGERRRPWFRPQTSQRYI